MSFLQATAITTDLTTYTFSAQNLGTEASDRYIIVGILSRKAGATTTISSVTIGGVSATIVRQRSNNVTNTDVAGLAIALVPTGATGDVVVTFGAGMVRCQIGVWRADSLASATPSDADDSIAGDPTVALDCPAGGFIIGVGLTAAASSASWTGITERFDTTLETFVTVTGASDTFASAQSGLTLLIDFATGSPVESVGVFASWEQITTAIKSVKGLAKASVKSVNGLAIASVKSINGLE